MILVPLLLLKALWAQTLFHSPGPAEVWSLEALGSPLMLGNLRLTVVEEAHVASGQTAGYPYPACLQRDAA